ncbi:MAG: hypothetical protein ACHQ0J_13625 [Candidatus Dormibacterales bacterium]
MREHITHVAFDMHQDSITAVWLPPGASTPELRTIPHEPKPFRRLVKEILAHGPAQPRPVLSAAASRRGAGSPASGPPAPGRPKQP